MSAEISTRSFKNTFDQQLRDVFLRKTRSLYYSLPGPPNTNVGLWGRKGEKENTESIYLFVFFGYKKRTRAEIDKNLRSVNVQ